MDLNQIKREHAKRQREYIKNKDSLLESMKVMKAEIKEIIGLADSKKQEVMMLQKQIKAFDTMIDPEFVKDEEAKKQSKKEVKPNAGNESDYQQDQPIH